MYLACTFENHKNLVKAFHAKKYVYPFHKSILGHLTQSLKHICKTDIDSKIEH